jgi:hypothetical protein
MKLSVYNESKPIGKILRAVIKFRPQRRETDQLPAGLLLHVERRVEVGTAEQHVVELVSDQSIAHVGLIDKAPELLKLTVQTHFGLQPSLGGGHDLLARPRVPATSVRPQPGGVLLAKRASLHQQFPTRVEDEDILIYEY